MLVTGQTLYQVRDMTPADVRTAQRLERAAYGPAAPGTPFTRELSNGLAHYLLAVVPSEAPGAQPEGSWLQRLVHRGQREQVVGFAGVWFMVDQLHLVTIAVDPAHQGRGVAHRLLLACFGLAAEAELRTVTLEVRASNLRAQQLYERFGFVRVGLLRRYYSDNNEDAIVMLTGELTAPDQRTRLRRLRDEVTGGDAP